VALAAETVVVEADRTPDTTLAVACSADEVTA
jgi:hypothetical protein